MDINQYKDAKTIKELTSVYRQLNTLIDNEGIDKLDHILKEVDIRNTSTELLVGLARFSYRWRNSLEYWQIYTNQMFNQLWLRDIDKRCLIGLVDR